MNSKFDDLVRSLDPQTLEELRCSVASELGGRREETAIQIEHIHPKMSAEAREAATTIFQEYISPGECAEIIQRAIDRATEKLREENLLFRDANNQLVIQRDQMEKLACEQSNQAHQLRAENEALRKEREKTP